VLRNEGDAAAAGVARRPEADVAAPEADPSLVRPEEAGGDRDERRLAGPVLAEEGVDLSPEDRQGRAVERPGRTEALRDRDELEKRQKLPRGTVRVPERISASARRTSSRTAAGTPAFRSGLQTYDTTPEARP